MEISESELQRLQSFRRAAEQVRDASIIAQGQSIKIGTAPGEPGYVDIFVKLLESEPFRSLALAVRLVYMQKEPASFYSICNLLSREGEADLLDKVSDVRRRFSDGLRASENSFHLDDGLDPAYFSAQEVFEHWLYGIAFHQDPARQNAVERLAAWGPHFTWRVQSVALQLAGRILDLDDLVADLLAEDRLPRIVPSVPGGGAT